MTTSTGPTVVDFPLRTPEEPLPLSQYAGHRRQSGLVQSHLPNGVPIWLVTRHEDVRAVLTHPKISANPDNEGFPNVGETMGVPKQDQIPGWFVGLDSPSTTVSARSSSPSSRYAASASCVPPSSGSSTSASTRCWPAATPRTWSTTSRCRCRPW